MTNKSVDNIINPYSIIRIEIGTDELDRIKDSDVLGILFEEISPVGPYISQYNNDCVCFQYNETIDYLIIRKDKLKKLKSILSEHNIKNKIDDYIEYLWESNDISEFIDSIPKKSNEYEYSDELVHISEFVPNILKDIVKSKYSTDDVLDKISKSGIESLNELNKYIL